jgi:hypothetical protein
MVLKAIHCPKCNSINVIKHTKTPDGSPAVSMSKSRVPSAYFYLRLFLPWLFAAGQATNRGYGNQWQWNSRFGKGAED